MAELIYNIKDLFSTNKEGCLSEYNAEKYHIAAYQRGYKWASDETGAVTILLNDLWSAFKKNESKEYYLQYITLKNDITGKRLEVIDGQQRITTLSILLSIFSLKLSCENIVKSKLTYSIRENFFEENIYKLDNLSNLLNTEWDDDMGIILNGNTINNQDVYYIFFAAKRIKKFLETDKSNNELNSFYNYILTNVKIIVNAVNHISSEKIFSNLNTKKVLLTDSELIKGLLLTKSCRPQSGEEKKHFKEILEMRMSIGRQWDEIAKWSNRSEIKSFFFKGQEGMFSLLTLVAIKNGYKATTKISSKDYPLFNFYHDQGKISEMFQDLLTTYWTLNDWYKDNEIYNLLGYLFFMKGSNKSIKDYLYGETTNNKKSVLRRALIKDVIENIPKDTKNLYFGDNDQDIHKVLLALNVFTDKSNIRFNFHRFIDEKWTLEHIFPQTIEGKEQVLQDKDKTILLEMIGDKATDEIKTILRKSERNNDEKELYQGALRGIRILDSIGNMCLLRKEDNSSNSCGFFDEKRTNILKRIQKGSFVPKHTFDVFSKMVFEKNPGDFERWTNENIVAHNDVIANKIECIIDSLNNDVKNESRKI